MSSRHQFGDDGGADVTGRARDEYTRDEILMMSDADIAA
jgi:hypothetical protein